MLKIAFASTNAANTPKLREVILQYVLYPPLKKQWTMRVLAEKDLKLLDGTTEARTADTIRTDLETLMLNQSLYTFVDIDGTSYTVLAKDIDESSWVVNQSTVNENEVAITLIEA